MDPALEQEVWHRSRGLCEYCGIPQALDPAPFQIDHIIAQQHGGPTRSDNLALSCLHDNKHKGPNIAGLDPLSGQLVPLFHPRHDYWAGHFEWNGAELVGRTAIGRATIQVLAINHPERLAVRQSLIDEGAFPPEPPLPPS